MQHIDTAEIYGNQDALGVGLQEIFKAGQVKRDELFITSKLWDTHHAADAVLPALQQTLSDLQIDYLDLFLIHW